MDRAEAKEHDLRVIRAWNRVSAFGDQIVRSVVDMDQQIRKTFFPNPTPINLLIPLACKRADASGIQNYAKRLGSGADGLSEAQIYNGLLVEEKRRALCKAVKRDDDFRDDMLLRMKKPHLVGPGARDWVERLDWMQLVSKVDAVKLVDQMREWCNKRGNATLGTLLYRGCD